jgi:hypothetical protein
MKGIGKEDMRAYGSNSYAAPPSQRLSCRVSRKLINEIMESRAPRPAPFDSAQGTGETPVPPSCQSRVVFSYYCRLSRTFSKVADTRGQSISMW